MNKCSILIFVLFFSLFFLKLSHSSDVIYVTADRILSDIEDSPSDIRVISEEEINKASTLPELLKNSSDLQLSSSGPQGANVSLFLRGTDSSHTLVILDGIIMNDPSNPNRQFDLGRMSLNNIEKIEILKGSQGLLYGSNAIGGVILITTKKNTNETPQINSTLSYGSFKTSKASLNYTQKISKFNTSLAVDHLKSQGFSAASKLGNPLADNDGEERLTLDSHLGYQFSKKLSGTFFYRGVFGENELDKGGGSGQDDVNDFQKIREQYLKTDLKINHPKSDTVLIATQAKHKRSLYTLPDAVHPESSTVKTNGESQTFAINHTQYFSEILTQNFNAEFSLEKDQRGNFNSNSSFFFYNRVELSQATLNAGVRIDSNKYFNEALTYKFATLYRFSQVDVKLSYSTGFRAPSLNQLFDPQYGNKSLRPELSNSFELGSSLKIFSNLNYTNALFLTKIKDRLSYDPVSFINQNSGEAEIVGFDQSLEKKFNDEFKSSFSLTYLRAQDKSNNVLLPRRPRVSAAHKIIYTFNPHQIELIQQYVGKRTDVDNQGLRVMTKQYFLNHLHYEYKFKMNQKLFLKINNLFDTNYVEVFGYESAKRNAEVGLQLSF